MDYEKVELDVGDVIEEIVNNEYKMIEMHCFALYLDCLSFIMYV